jgi:hypothetical protein
LTRATIAPASATVAVTQNDNTAMTATSNFRMLNFPSTKREIPRRHLMTTCL